MQAGQTGGGVTTRTIGETGGFPGLPSRVGQPVTPAEGTYGGGAGEGTAEGTAEGGAVSGRWGAPSEKAATTDGYAEWFNSLSKAERRQMGIGALSAPGGVWENIGRTIWATVTKGKQVKTGTEIQPGLVAAQPGSAAGAGAFGFGVGGTAPPTSYSSIAEYLRKAGIRL